MKQIITGPHGRVAYHNAVHRGMGQYPALNMPNREFARGESLLAANDAHMSNVVPLARAIHNRAMVSRMSISATR